MFELRRFFDCERRGLSCAWIALSGWALFAAVCAAPVPADAGELIVRSFLSAELRYDVNSRALSDGTTEGPSDEELLLLSPRVEVLDRGTRYTVTASYRPSWSFHRREPGTDTINHYASLGTQVTLSRRWTAEAIDSVTYTPESLDPTVVGIQRTRRTNTVLVRTNYLATAHLSAAAEASETILDFDDPAAINTRSRTAGASINWGIGAHTSVFTAYSATRLSFEGAGSESDIFTQSLSVGVSQGLPREFTVDLSGGVVSTESLIDRYEWIGNVALRKSIRSFATRVAYSRSTSHAMGLSDQLNLGQRYAGDVTYTLSPSSSIGVLATYSIDRTEPVAAVESRAYNVALNGSWRPRSWLSVSAGYSLHRQRIDHLSPTMWEELRRNLLYVSLQASFDEWKL